MSASASPRWQLEPPGTGVRIALFVLALLLPVAVTAIALGLSVRGDAPDVRLVGGNAWLTLAIVVVTIIAAWWWLQRALGRHRIVLEDGMIDIATTFYRRRLALDQLRLDTARVVDLDERTELKPMLKTNGTSLPGLHSGWYRLRNRDKALVATLGGKRVLWIPTCAGYDLLLQPRHPQTLLDTLRQLAQSATRR